MAATRARRLAALEARSRDDVATAIALMSTEEKARIRALLRAGDADEAGAILAQHLSHAGKRWQPGRCATWSPGWQPTWRREGSMPNLDRRLAWREGTR